MITSYKELTIGKYLEILDVLKDKTDELEVQCELLSVLSDKSYDEIMGMSLDDYHAMVSKTSFLTKPPVITKNVPSKLTIAGKAYRITKNLGDINVAQYVDYQTYSKHNERNKNAAQLLSCFIIPEGCKYGEGYDVNEVISSIRDNMSTEDALSVCFFFQKKYRTLIQDTLIYLEWKLRRMSKKNLAPEMRMKIAESEKMMQQLRGLL